MLKWRRAIRQSLSNLSGRTSTILRSVERGKYGNTQSNTSNVLRVETRRLCGCWYIADRPIQVSRLVYHSRHGPARICQTSGLTESTEPCFFRLYCFRLSYCTFNPLLFILSLSDNQRPTIFPGLFRPLRRINFPDKALTMYQYV